MGVDDSDGGLSGALGTDGGIMDIKWRHDVGQVLKEAKEQKRPALLDFSAAPM